MEKTINEDFEIGVDAQIPTPPENATPEDLYDYLCDRIRSYHPNINLEQLNKAYNLACEAHEGQLRKSGEPYIIHPLKVGIILASLELDKETIIAGILHDVVEDTNYTLEDIKKIFGEDVANLVDGVTKLGEVSLEQDKLIVQAENLRKMVIAMARDIRVVLIKLADRLHNMRTLQYMSREKQIEKARETLEIYAPLAHRLGIFKIKVELDDLSLRYLEPELYFNLIHQINLRQVDRDKFINEIVNEVKQHMSDINIDCKVYGRVKHVFSIYKKMLRKHKTLDQIYDLFAVRIIVKEPIDCYTSIYCLHDLYAPVKDRFKDYIAIPKANNYRSIHTTVTKKTDVIPFEIQIRTEEMHKFAEYGIAAHWRYKEGKSGESKDKFEDKMMWLRRLLELHQDLKDDEEFVKSVKEDFDLLSDNIYCFTSTGDVITLKDGSNTIDFAYAIHSAIGNKMVGAKINGKIVNIDTKINSGDRVEILTSKNSRGPSLDWLNIVYTTSAKNKIKQWFRNINKEENIVKGKTIINNYIKLNKLNLNDLLKNKYLDKLLSRYSLKDWNAVLAAVGHGGIKESTIINRLLEEYKKDNNIVDDSIKDEPIEKSNKAKPDLKIKTIGTIKVNGVDDLSVKISKCCNPVPGDEIVGFITRGRGVSVHRVDCKNIVNLPFEDRQRLIPTKWTENITSNFLACINIHAINKKGTLNKVTKLISENDVDISSMKVSTTKNGQAILQTEIYVKDKYSLNKIIDKIRKIPDIIDIERVVN